MKKWDDLFEPYRSTLETFASDNNLELEKYYRDYPTWSFRFAHPHKGFAKLQVGISDDGPIISGSWRIDRSDELKRYSKFFGPIASQSSLSESLAEALAIVRGWQPDDWTMITDLRLPKE